MFNGNFCAYEWDMLKRGCGVDLLRNGGSQRCRRTINSCFSLHPGRTCFRLTQTTPNALPPLPLLLSLSLCCCACRSSPQQLQAVSSSQSRPRASAVPRVVTSPSRADLVTRACFWAHRRRRCRHPHHHHLLLLLLLLLAPTVPSSRQRQSVWWSCFLGPVMFSYHLSLHMQSRRAILPGVQA